MKLEFENDGYGRDFAAFCDLPPKLKPLDPDGEHGGAIRLAAYDTSVAVAHSVRDRMLHENGIEFDCEVVLVYTDEPTGNDRYLCGFTARDEETAKRLLQAAADALYE